MSNEHTKKIKGGKVTKENDEIEVVTGENIYPEGEVPEVEIEVTIEDTGKDAEEFRIVPKKKLDVFPEESFTLNDIISEIEIETRRNSGVENDRVKELRNALKKFDIKAKEVESLRPPKVEPVEEESTEEASIEV